MNITRLEHQVQEQVPESGLRTGFILRIYSDEVMGLRLVIDDGGSNEYTADQTTVGETKR